MNSVKRVEFTITRAEVWQWIKTISAAIWLGQCRVKLHLDTTNQTFVHEPDGTEKNNESS